MEPPQPPKDTNDDFKNKVVGERRSSAPSLSGSSISKRGSIGRRFSLIGKPHQMHPPKVNVIQIFQEQEQPTVVKVETPKLELSLRRRISQDKDVKLADLLNHDKVVISETHHQRLCAAGMLDELLNLQSTPASSPREEEKQSFETAISSVKKSEDFFDSIVFGHFWFTELHVLLEEINNRFSSKEINFEGRKRLLHLLLKLELRFQQELLKPLNLQTILKTIALCLREPPLEYKAKDLLENLRGLAIQYIDLHGTPNFSSSSFRLFLALAKLNKDYVGESRRHSKEDIESLRKHRAEERRLRQERKALSLERKNAPEERDPKLSSRELHDFLSSAGAEVGEQKKKMTSEEVLLNKLNEQKDDDIEPITYCATDRKEKAIPKAYHQIFHQIEESILNDSFSENSIDYVMIANALKDSSIAVFQSISYKEFFDKNWTRKNKNELSPNIIKLSENFEKIAYYVSQTILKFETPEQRGRIISFFIRLANQCTENLDFHSAVALVNGLENPFISRLELSFDKLHKETKEILKNLVLNFDPFGNYKMLRRVSKELHDLKKGYVPAIAIDLRDINGLDESPSLLEQPPTSENRNPPPKLNIDKLEKYGIIFKHLYQCQKSLKVSQGDFVDLCDLIDSVQLHEKGSDVLRQLSHTREPRTNS